MEQLKLIRQLQAKGYSIKAIARSMGISRNTARKYVSRLSASGGSLPGSVQEDALVQCSTRYGQLFTHFTYAEEELKKTGVTRQQLWLEYKGLHATGYNYSQYCYHFSQYLRHKEVVMHLDHKAAECAMVDFAGQKLHYVDADSGEVISCQVFVSVLPASGLIYCRAVHSQRTGDFVQCIGGMLVYYGGVPRTIVCDNLKTAVSRPDRYEPVFTELCYQLSEHYGTCFSATRPYKPRDKAMVERAVYIVYQNIYAPLRKTTFHSLTQLNEAIARQLEVLNRKPYKNSPYSRRDLFEQSEHAALSRLPREVFVHKKVVYATVQRNYHIQLSQNHHYYSVPYRYAGKKVKVLYDETAVEVYLDQQRIALHHRTAGGSVYHTLGEHMPPHHQKIKQFHGWTAEELLARASRVGDHTRQAAGQIQSSSIYPQQNFKACHGMILLQNRYGVQRLEAACRRAAATTRATYTMIRSILQNGLDRQNEQSAQMQLPVHENIRGPLQYQ